MHSQRPSNPSQQPTSTQLSDIIDLLCKEITYSRHPGNLATPALRWTSYPTVPLKKRGQPVTFYKTNPPALTRYGRQWTAPQLLYVLTHRRLPPRALNVHRSGHGKTGERYVYLREDRRRNPYMVLIPLPGAQRRLCVGQFETKADAVAARDAALETLSSRQRPDINETPQW